MWSVVSVLGQRASIKSVLQNDDRCNYVYDLIERNYVDWFFSYGKINTSSL